MSVSRTLRGQSDGHSEVSQSDTQRSAGHSEVSQQDTRSSVSQMDTQRSVSRTLGGQSVGLSEQWCSYKSDKGENKPQDGAILQPEGVLKH